MPYRRIYQISPSSVKGDLEMAISVLSTLGSNTLSHNIQLRRNPSDSKMSFTDITTNELYLQTYTV